MTVEEVDKLIELGKQGLVSPEFVIQQVLVDAQEHQEEAKKQLTDILNGLL